MTNTTRNEWARITRSYNKAMDALEHAKAKLVDNSDADDFVVDAAWRLLEEATKRVNAGYTADRKRLNIAIYSPYGAK